MRELQDRINEIEKNDLGCDRPISTKGGWLKLQNDVTLINKIVPSIIAELKNIESDRTNIPEYSRNAGVFTMVQKDNRVWPWRIEDALERCIVVSSPGIRLYNQVSVNDGRESIDLAKQNSQQEWTDLIELKPWDSGNNPLFALSEITKNYFLFKTIPGVQTDKVSIKIAAPDDYFKSYKVDFSSNSLLPELCKAFAKELGIGVSVLSNTLSEEEFFAETKKKIDSNKWQPAQNTTKQYTNQQEIEPFTIEELAFKNWKQQC